MAPFAILVAATLAATPRIAVMPIAPGDAISDKSASFLTETLAAEIRQQTGVEVITSRDLGSVLSLERQKQALGCTTDSCMAEIAGAAGAERLVAGDVARLGESLLLQLRMLDAKRGRVLAQSRRRYKNGTFDDVLDALPAMAGELLRGGGVTAPATTATSAPGAPRKDAAMDVGRPAPQATGEVVLHYRRRNHSYDSVRLHSWSSGESGDDLRKPSPSPVPRNEARSYFLPGTSHLPMAAPAGQDSFGAYWTFPSSRFANGRVNFVLAIGGDWDDCGVDNGRFWLIQDGREAWYLGAPDCKVTTDPAVARSAAGR